MPHLQCSPESIALRSVGIGLLKENDPRRASLVAELDGLVAKIDNPQDRFHAAEALFAAKQYAKAADLYAGLHGRDSDNLALRRHLTALNRADHRQEARQLFESLAANVKALPEYAEAGAAIYERSVQVGYATDLVFRSPTILKPLYQQLSRQAILTVKAP